MTIAFYLAGAIAILATVMTVTRLNAVHALLYLVISLLAVAIVFYTLGAPFVAALEIITYAGAIMVLFIFVVMLLNLGQEAIRAESVLLRPSMWIGPGVLAAALIVELLYLMVKGLAPNAVVPVIPSAAVGTVLFGPYLIGFELASMLLLAGLVGAYHVGRRGPEKSGAQ